MKGGGVRWRRDGACPPRVIDSYSERSAVAAAMMPIRDIVLVTVVFGLLPVCVARPWVGLLVWSWLGFMNPHRLTWGFAYDLPFAELVALATLAGVLFAGDRKPFLWTRDTMLL